MAPFLLASMVQWTRRDPPKVEMQVRSLLGALVYREGKMKVDIQWCSKCQTTPPLDGLEGARYLEVRCNTHAVDNGTNAVLE